MAATPLFLVCNISGPVHESVDVTRLCYASADGQLVQSTLVAIRGAATDRLMCTTDLRSGARLVEEATVDRRGRLVSATAVLEPSGEGPATRVRLDPGRGVVEINTPALHLAWAVANDLPWVWAPLLTEPSSGASLATPLDAQIVYRAAAAGLPVRQLDLGALTGHTVAADQLLVSDGATTIVILGNDAIEIESGFPRLVHLAALGATLQPVKPGQRSDVVAAVAGCKPTNGLFVP